MNRRLILKTVFLCCGIFLILGSLVGWLLMKYIKIDTEESIDVYTAAFQISEGSTLNDTNISLKTIKVSAYNRNMVKSIDESAGKIAVVSIEEGDYIRKSDIQAVSDMFNDDDRIRTIPMDINARQANIVKKGSLIDLDVKLNGEKSFPKIVISKIKVEDVLDENGLSLGQNNNAKTAYIKLILNKEQRKRLDAAADLGTLFCETYGNSMQSPALEDFIVPSGYDK